MENKNKPETAAEPTKLPAKKKHKKWPWIVLASVVGANVILLSTCALILKNAKNVPNNYWNQQITGGPIEKKYAPLGSFEVASKEYAQEKVDGKEKHFKFFHPKATGKYPLVVMVNGTGVPYQQYEQVFEHLASWGYAVVGDDYDQSWDGVYPDKALSFALSNGETSPWVDEKKIAIGGHSQGGEGTFNAAIDFANSPKYKCLFALSATNQELALSLGWGHKLGSDGKAASDSYAYDLSKISCPALMFAGTGNFDTQTVLPLEKLKENYSQIPNGIPTVMARRGDNVDHGEMLWRSDPYVVAWLEYWLKGDEEAGKAFFGSDCELAKNVHWQDYASRQ
jgi:dienelactone hydrolase